MRRRLLLFFAALVAAVVVGVVALPLWFGAALRWGGESRGLTFARYERLGYARFALHDVEVKRPGLRVTAKRVEVDSPTLWLWRHWRGNAAEIVAGDWSVEVQRRADAPKPATPSGWVPLRRTLQRVATQLERFVPRARAGAGVVRFPGGEISVASAAWANRKLTVDDLAFRALKVDGSAAFPADNDLIAVELRAADGGALKLESRAEKIAGEVTWWEQRGTLSARFNERGWLPPEATLAADAIRLPGARLKLGELYAAVTGRGRIDWSSDHFVADITANGEPLEGKKAPPLQLALRGRGDARAFTVEALDAALPGVTAKLNQPVTIERTGALRDGAPARFTVNADLAQQPWLEARGAIAGEARVLSTAGSAVPRVEFQLNARGVAAKDLALAQVGARGELAWPQLRVASGEIVGGEGERLTWRGGWDFKAKELLDVLVDGEIRRRSLARWLPAQPEFETVKVHAEAAGPLASMTHRGNAKADAVKFRPIDAAAVTLEWRGRGLAAEEFFARVTTGATSLAAGGSADRTAVTLRALELARENKPLLRLARPAVLRWQPALQLESLQLAGADASLTASVTWAETGRLEIAARNVSSDWLADLFPSKAPAWRLELLAISGEWDRGPMTFSVSGGASVDLGEGRTAAVNVAARGDKGGLRIEALRATEGGQNVVNATGRVPLVLQPRAVPLVRIDPDGALQLDASAVPNAAFWQKLASASGLELKMPEAALHVKGTWQRPQGDVTVKAERIAFDPQRFKRELPAIDQLDVRLTADRGGVTLDTFALNVEGQPVRAAGRLPIPEQSWGEALKQPLALAQRGADARLEVPEADVAVFARFLPAFLAPKGRLQLDVRYKSGGFDGVLRLRDAATRPLGPLGVLQEINADLALAGRTLELREVSAKSGGQPVTLTGRIELPAAEAGAGARALVPRYDVALRGENLPFVRQTGLLLRGDLDLKLQTTADPKVAKISGHVRLRDSLFLQDVRAFLPRGGGGGGARRPPYFEVNTPPVNAWTLAVDVTGDEFLRLRTPVFVGVASARFHLGGTLGDPRAIGSLEIDEGRVRMPFASFEVKQGAVRLTEANPYEPEIYLRGTGRRYGYDLAVEIEGRGTSPNVTFTSSPALDSEQVLLMVMTGAAPQNEITKSGTQRMASIGYFLGQSLLGSVGGDDAERLSIASGEKVSRQGRETYDIEYKLSDRWAVTGEYNEFDEYNAGFKWRAFPRKTDEEKRKEAMAKKTAEPAETGKHAQK